MAKEQSKQAKWKIVQCLRCEYEWPTKQQRPNVCPSCKTQWWDNPPENPRPRPKKT